MSFGGGFAGFGSGASTSSTTGFGGFGASNNNNNNNNNTSGGFGSNTNNPSGLFGSTNPSTSTNVFGGNSNTSSPFGGGGFGASNTPKTTFGSTPFGGTGTGGGLFGNAGGASSGNAFGGGFGAANNSTATSAFNTGANTGGGLFGNKPATGFGASSTGGGGLFGGGTTGGFGATNNNTGGFGASTGGFGAGAATTQNTGTANTPFQAFTEKDGATGSGQSQYETITFQQPYQKFSLEELRVVDYNQGRRYGNQNGQAGAFGQSTGFGGFGSSNTSGSNAFGGGNNTTTTGSNLFGGGNTGTTTTGFGQTTGSAFGATNNTSGGNIFGQAKPAAGGLFGASNTTSTTGTGGGLFGSAATTNNTTAGFGSGGGGFGASSNTGGGLFGSAKPAGTGGLFGGSGTASNTTSTPFGGTTNTSGFGQSNTGGGLFGQPNNQNSTTTPAFGASNNTTNTGGGLFGGTSASGFGQSNQSQPQAQTTGGLFGGGGAFGQSNQQNQAKPGGLFGASTTASSTGGGLFGQSTTQTQPSTGLFGGSTANNSTSSGLFGQKPATATSGLFGSSTAGNTGQAGGLFGGLNTQNTQQNSSGSLFGSQNTQQKPGGLFGGSTSNTNSGGGGLFGNMGQSNQQQTMGGSLFPSSNQPPQQQVNNTSLFGASGSSLLNTSMNTNPYGNDALFAGLATPTQSPGPLATPLSSNQKNKRVAILPQHKLNPAASTRLLTPQNKRPGGYGFTYSTYGTPASTQSQNSPSFAGSLFASNSLSRSLGKSLSTSNLRNSFSPETSILAPGAFSTTGRSFGNGSLKKLNVNRSINTRIPLFDEPSQKRVSFVGGENANGNINGETALVVREEEPASSPRSINGDAGRDTPRPSMQQINNSELTRVPEDRVLTPKPTSSVNAQASDSTKPGDYWSNPTIAQLKRMSRQELKNVDDFTVGRDNVGHINFHHGKPVDLSEVNLEKLFGDIVQLTPRNATVYGETCTCLPKPPLGSALNQPSKIVLGNSWPRNGKSGKKDVKHLERLKRVNGTTFIGYNQSNGEWTFTVPHFSSYGLNDDDYSNDEDESSFLSDAPDTPAQPQSRSHQVASTPQEESFVSPQSQSSPDDTFDFKKGMRSRNSVPGGFSDEAVFEEGAGEDTQNQSFLGQRSVGSFDGQQDADYSEESESEMDQNQDMADSVSGSIQTTEQAAANSDPCQNMLKPKSILKASQIIQPGMGTPAKGKPVFDDDWASQLQRTISPKKQDRPVFREGQGYVLGEQDMNIHQTAPIFESRRPIATAIDLMESLFGDTKKQKLPKRGGQGIELPYPKRPKTASDLNQLNAFDKDFHNCSKPHFSQTNILVYGNKGPTNLESGVHRTAQEPLIGDAKDIRFAHMPTFEDSAPETLSLQKQYTKMSTADKVPAAHLQVDPAPIEFSDMAKAVAIDSKAGFHEQQAWQLLSLLYDDADKIPEGVDKEHRETHKKERLSEFWKLLVWDDAQTHASQATSVEERAIAYLSCNNVADACHALLEGLDLRLATMVAQIGGDYTMRQNMATQIEEWRRLDVLSEMEDSHRALYELISGNCARAEGKLGAGRENKASTFGISSRFALDWRRAFGLRLWYGILADEPIELAIAQFADAMADGKEDVKPVPWFVRHRTDMGWDDTKAENREDLLWGILKLYAASRLELAANVEDILAPENVSGHPLNARLSFQLFQLFRSRQEDDREASERKVGMPTVRSNSEEGHRSSFLSTKSPDNNDSQAENPLVEMSDKITLTYAASLHTVAHWTTAIWVYTHLSSPAMREHYIRSLLNQFSNTYVLEESNSTYSYLVRDLCIPTTWLHAAAALQAKYDGDSLCQATHLIKADELEEAHEVLCRRVGPDAIISRDYDPLRELIGGFLPSPSNTPNSATRAVSARHLKPVPGWAQGGQIYFDYIELIDLTSQWSTHRVDEKLNARISELLVKLQSALVLAARDRLTSCGLEERVALMDIAGTVANLIAKIQPNNRAVILKLPLTEDLWLKHSCELSTSYYRGVMAGR